MHIQQERTLKAVEQIAEQNLGRLPWQSRFLIHSIALFTIASLLFFALMPPNKIIPSEFYLPMHSVLELLATIISAMVFALGWNLRGITNNKSVVFLACGFFLVASLDLLHMLSYQGMPTFVTPSGPEKAINFWLAGRFVAAAAFLGAALLSDRSWSALQCRLALTTAMALLAGCSWLFLFHADWLPRTFIAGSGLTPLKIHSEYLLITLYAISALLLVRKGVKTHQQDYYGIAAAAWLLAVCELFFSAYGDVTDLFNMVGHILKTVAYLFVFQSIFVSGVRRPYLAQAHDKALLRALIDSVPDLIFFKDPQSAYLGFNRAFAAYCGKTEQDMQGKTDHSFAPPEIAEFYRRKDREMLEGGKPQRNEEWISYPDGRRILLDTLKTPFYGPDGEVLGLIGISRDITEKKAAEEQLKRANQELETVTYVASHDLQEPVRSITSYLQLLQRDYGGKLGKDADQYITFAVEGAHRMHQQIRDILAFSRIGTDGASFSPTPLENALHDAKDNLSGLIAASGASITHTTLPVVKGDPRQLSILLTHLLSNAIKYQRAGIPPVVHINALLQANGLWLVSVRDNGIGIEPQYWHKIFDIFQRLHSRESYEGTGIGLAICRRIVERHGGEIWVESSPDRGSTFFFTLPA